MIDLILVILLLVLIAPMAGLYVVAGTLALIIKIVFVIILVGLVSNVLLSRRFW